ncbi:hypothetical protein Pint_27010 [Pistacia integerrima]|uniref:Uncharacterized protein n=1 Tax=Pistacia integerrima TaxID=434235 RepID=A0ACC0YPZ3_9ROSI|nr:hypothetical protein Pint_27010 [Pistacia integerrima]
MASRMMRNEHKGMTTVAPIRCSPKQNFMQRLCQMLCGGANSPTNEQPNQKVGRSNGINGDGPEKMGNKHFGNSDREAERKASGSHKAGQSWENNKETSNGRPADNTWEQPVKNKINGPEKPVYSSSSQEDFMNEAMNKNGKYKDPEPPKVIIRSFDQQSEAQQKEGIKREKNSENQTKRTTGSTEQAAGLPQRNEKQNDSAEQPSHYRDHKFTETSPPKTTTSSFGLDFVMQPSFNKDDKYADASFPKPTKSSAAPQIKDDKYADTSPLPTAKSSSAPQIVRQTSFKDKKYEDTNPSITTKSSVVPQIVRQTSFKDKKYADTSPPITTTSSGGTHKYSDTSTPTKTKSSFMQNFVRQTSFNDDDKYRNTRVGQKDVKDTNFCEDDKYTDTNNPPKTSRSSVSHTSLEQQKGVSKQENYNENQVNTRPSSSMSTNISSLGQGGQYQSQKSVAKPEGINKDVKTTGLNHPSGIKSTEHAPKEQHKGVLKQDNSYEIDRDVRSDPSKVTISGSRQK